MSIALPSGLPAADQLRNEGLPIGLPDGAARRLRVALVNLMPDRPTTECQFARLLAASRHPVELVLAVPDGVTGRDEAGRHLARFYRPWTAVEESGIDAVIVTGAPVERLDFAAVRFWPQLTRILDWTRGRAVPSYFVCWAAQAALWHAHRIAKRDLPEKAFGVFAQALREPAPILGGIGPSLLTPVSRHTMTAAADLLGRGRLKVLADCGETGLGLASDPSARAHYMLNHVEYDADTLAREYARDRAAGRPVRQPRGYFPMDDPSATPVAFWRPQAVRLFRNWLDEVAAVRDAATYSGRAKKSCIERSMKATSPGRRKDAAM